MIYFWYTLLVIFLVLPALALVCAILLCLVKPSNFKEVAYWYLKATAYFCLGAPLIVLGLFIVPIALLSRVEHPETRKPFSDARQAPGDWMLVTLRETYFYFSNEFDGAWGDTRGWYNNWCLEKLGKTCQDFLSMYIWLAIRNPTNGWSRITTGCDVSLCDISVIWGSPLADEDNAGISFIVATNRETGRKYHSLNFWFPWFFDATHAVYGRFGWKIKMSHNGVTSDSRINDRIKGAVYRMSPWKAL